MGQKNDASFSKYQTRRDAALLCNGVGSLALFLSTAYLLLNLATGFGLRGWTAYYIGPASLAAALLLLPLGRRLNRSAQEYFKRL